MAAIEPAGLDLLYVGPDPAAIRAAMAELEGVTAEATLDVVDSVSDALSKVTRTYDCLLLDVRRDDAVTSISNVATHQPELPILALAFDRATAADAHEASAATVYVCQDDGLDASILAARIAAVTDETGADAIVESILDALDEVFYVVDADGDLQRWNDSLESVTGYAGDELAEMNALDLLEGADRRRVSDLLADPEADAEGRVRLNYVTKDGRSIPYSFTGSKIRGPDGTVRGYVGIGRDISDRVERERELALRNAAIAAAPLGITIHDATAANNPIVYAHDTVAELTGYDRETIHGAALTMLAGAETERLPEVTAAMDRGEAATVEALLYRRDGSPFWSRLSVSPIRLDDAVSHVVCFHEDITESKEHQQQIERRLDELGDILVEKLHTPVREAREDLVHAQDVSDDEGIDDVADSLDRTARLIDDIASLHSYRLKSREMTSEAIREAESDRGDDIPDVDDDEHDT